MTDSINLVSDLALRTILPPSITDDDQLTAVADGLDPESHSIVSDAAVGLPYMANIGTLPERILDLLAWQFHVDFYESDLTLAQKRELVRGAIAFHRIQGTRAAVQSVLDTVFGVGNADLAEWFEYGGDPYTFTVATRLTLSESIIARFSRAIAVAKNVRSHYTLQQMKSEDMSVKVGFAQHMMIYRTSVAE
jgi:phage tail P2-like protein